MWRKGTCSWNCYSEKINWLEDTVEPLQILKRLNLSRVVLRTNTCRAENLVTHSRRVVRANRNESIIRLSKVHSTLVVRKWEVLVTPEVRDYVIPVVCKDSLIDFSSLSNPTLIVSKCSDVIPCKFKAVKFTIE